MDSTGGRFSHRTSGSQVVGHAGANGAARRADAAAAGRPCSRTAPRRTARATPDPSSELRPTSRPFLVTSLHTLGPAGTNCELAANEWFARQGRRGTVVLHHTLEEAADEACRTPGAALLVAVAYPNLHTLIYAHIGRLELADSIITMTHNMVLARRRGVATPASVATHPAPAGLVPDGLAPQFVTSNAQAALDCAAGTVDACITTMPAMAENGLELLRDFGPIAMAFTVHVRTDAARAERA